MKIFVTGGTGFVGSHLVDALLKRDHEVACLVRSEAKFHRVFPERKPHLVLGSLNDLDALHKGVGGCDAVFHSAALITARNRREFFEVNVEATRRLLEATRDAAPNIQRFVYVSSQAASGPAKRGTPKLETDPALPVSNYGASKLASERLVQESDSPWTIVRPPGVYGPRDTSFITVFRMVKLPIFPTLGSAEQELSLIYVDDLVEALLVAMDNPACLSKTYFACHPEVVTSRGLAGHFYRAVKGLDEASGTGPTIVTLPAWLTKSAMSLTGAAARIAGRATLLSPDKAKELLADAWTCSAAALQNDTGWKAETGLAAGTRTTVRWYREQGLL